jgi:hypothetical protein
MHVVAFGYEHAAVAVRAGVFDGREYEVPIEVVAREMVLTQPRRLNPGFYDAVIAAFKTAGVALPLHEIEGATVEQLLLQVAAGGGMALVPGSVVDRIRLPGVAFRHLAPRASVCCQLAAVTAEPVRSETLARFLAALPNCLPGPAAARSPSRSRQAPELPRPTGAPVSIGSLPSSDQAGCAAQVRAAVLTTSATSLG